MPHPSTLIFSYKKQSYYFQQVHQRPMLSLPPPTPSPSPHFCFWRWQVPFFISRPYPLLACHNQHLRNQHKTLHISPSPPSPPSSPDLSASARLWQPLTGACLASVQVHHADAAAGDADDQGDDDRAAEGVGVDKQAVYSNRRKVLPASFPLALLIICFS